MDLFATILGKRDRILDFQIEAAKTFQAWGDAGNSDAYLKAVRGARVGKDGRNIIWGWGRLASSVGRPELLDKKPVFRATLHEARYNLALCRYKYGLVEQNRRRELLLKAKRDSVVPKDAIEIDVVGRSIERLAVIHQDMGGAVRQRTTELTACFNPNRNRVR